MIRLRRMMRAAGQKNNMSDIPPVSGALPQPVQHVEPPVQPVINQPEAPQTHAAQYIPPALGLEQPIPQNTIQTVSPIQMPAAAVTGLVEPVVIEDIYSNHPYSTVNAEQNSSEQAATSSIQTAVSEKNINTEEAVLSNDQPQKSDGLQVNPYLDPQKLWQQKKGGKQVNHEAKNVKNITLNKIIHFISQGIFYLLIFLVAIMAIFMVKSKLSGGTPSVLGYQIYGVLSGSMNGKEKTSFDTGSMVFVKYKDPKKIVVGDIITFSGLSLDSPLTTHRVVKVNQGDKLSFTTRGDANNVDDPNPIAAERVVGTVRGHLPYLGYLTGFAETKTGLIFLIFIPGSLVIIYEAVSVFKVLKTERKKGKKD